MPFFLYRQQLIKKQIKVITTEITDTQMFSQFIPFCLALA